MKAPLLSSLWKEKPLVLELALAECSQCQIGGLDGFALLATSIRKVRQAIFSYVREYLSFQVSGDSEKLGYCGQHYSDLVEELLALAMK